jgi:hypothetical protein
VRIEEIGFEGHDAVALEAGRLRAIVVTGVGPRIASFTSGDHPNLLAWLPGAGIDLDDGRRFSFYGGHRLWVAPEVPEWTYEPDDDPVPMTAMGDAVRFEVGPGRVPLRKVLQVAIDGDHLVVDHAIINERDRPVALAAWAITQFTPGGVGIVPLPDTPADTHGLQASRLLVGWPYTDFGDPLLGLDGDLVTVTARRATPTKVGVELHRGWLAYVVGSTAFVKRADHVVGARYPDLGASAECYCNDVFLELETLSPVWELPPGEEVQHREQWKLVTVEEGASADEMVAAIEEAAT